MLTLSFGPNTLLIRYRMSLEIKVHRHGCGNSDLTLELAEVLRSEQELPIQVALLYRVQVGDMGPSIRSSAETNHRPILEHLASNGTCTDEELPMVGDLMLEVAAEDGDLGVVPCSQGLNVRLSWEGFGEGLKRVEVHVLHHRVELCTDGFEHFLGHKPADHGIDGRKIPHRLE